MWGFESPSPISRRGVCLMEWLKIRHREERVAQGRNVHLEGYLVIRRHITSGLVAISRDCALIRPYRHLQVSAPCLCEYVFVLEGKGNSQVLGCLYILDLRDCHRTASTYQFYACEARLVMGICPTVFFPIPIIHKIVTLKVKPVQFDSVKVEPEEQLGRIAHVK